MNFFFSKKNSLRANLEEPYGSCTVQAVLELVQIDD